MRSPAIATACAIECGIDRNDLAVLENEIGRDGASHDSVR
jgi:hypothetical protein